MSVPFHLTTRSIQGAPQTGGGEASGFTYVNLGPLSSSPENPAMRWVITGISCSVTGATSSELYVTSFDSVVANRLPLYDMFAAPNLVQRFDPPLSAAFGFSGIMIRHTVVDDPPPGGHSTTLNVQGRIEGTIDRTVVRSNATFRDIDAELPPGGWQPQDWPGYISIG